MTLFAATAEVEASGRLFPAPALPITMIWGRMMYPVPDVNCSTGLHLPYSTYSFKHG